MASIGYASLRLTQDFSGESSEMARPVNPFRKDVPQDTYRMEVVVDAMDEGSGTGGGVANFLTGYVVYNDEKLRFDAIAYGRIGGQNVSPMLTEDTLKRLRELSVDIDVFTEQLQRKLVEGEITVKLPEGAQPPSLDS